MIFQALGRAGLCIEEIRCQFIILEEIRCQFIILVRKDEPTSDYAPKSMERTRQALEKLQLRIAAGKLKQPEKIGATAERLL